MGEWAQSTAVLVIGLLSDRREVFQALGGYASQPLMEDVDFVALAGQSGLPVKTSRGLNVCTSATRWEWYGTISITGLNQLVLLGRALGVPVARLAMWYRGFPKDICM